VFTYNDDYIIYVRLFNSRFPLAMFLIIELLYNDNICDE